MKCELCHVNDACIEVKQVAEDVCREVHLCEECAAQKGLKTTGDLAGLLMGGGLFPLAEGEADAASPAGDLALPGCPGCHMRASDFRKTGRLGCGRCYETFAALLEPMIYTMQRAASRHQGKHPVRTDVQKELKGLKIRLDQAIRKEAFEEAAGLRDRIRVLELADICLTPVEDGSAAGDGCRKVGQHGGT